MPVSIKTKQVAGVALMVGLSVLVVSGWTLATLASVYVEEIGTRADLAFNVIYQRAFSVALGGHDPIAGFRTDTGLASALQAVVSDDIVVHAVISDPSDVVIVGHDDTLRGQLLKRQDDLSTLLNAGSVAQLRTIFAGARTYERSEAVMFGSDKPIAVVRVGVSTLLIRDKLEKAMLQPLITAGLTIVLSTLMAFVFAHIGLRPIHVIRSGLARLGRGELDVSVDLPPDADLGDLSESFKAVTARLAAGRTELAGQRATLESVVDHFEDAVALFGPDATLLFANTAMRPALGADHGSVKDLLPADHPYRRAVEDVLATRADREPETVELPGGDTFLVLTHPVADAQGQLLGVMLVARNLTYISKVESTLSYSRKLAALGRLSAGIAHEVKNPLNATMIHLELLKMQLADSPASLEHANVIAAQVRRLDEVVQGLLKFTRPEDLKLEPVSLAPLFEGIMPIVIAEAGKFHVEVRLEVPPTLPPASADPNLLQQAFLNLALNACQAMPHGGRLRMAASVKSRRQLEILFEDDGIGIPPEQLSRIFDLYFTTKEHGSGIGLSLVYRTIQLHDGDIEAQSVPGHGTTFRVLLPIADRGVSGPGLSDN